MTGRRRTRGSGALRKPAAQAARSAAYTAARAQAATDSLAAFGVAYARLLSAARKATKRGHDQAVSQKIPALTTQLNTTAAHLETLVRR